jgi:hypothetical protein
VDDTGQITVRAEAIDPHPEEMQRWSCAANPLVDSAGAHSRRLSHGEVPSRPYVATEFCIHEGATITVLGERNADGTVGAPARGRQHFFAPASPGRIAQNAHRGSITMTKLAGALAVVSAALIGAGMLLR